MGFRTSAHAGEASGPQSVWGAINVLKAERIGHGTRAIEDENLVQFLAKSQIPIELNPISNLRTRVVDSLRSHPTRQYLDRGLMVCVNSDDPRDVSDVISQRVLAVVSAVRPTPGSAKKTHDQRGSGFLDDTG